MNKKNQPKPFSWSIIYLFVFALILATGYIYFFKKSAGVQSDHVPVVTNQESNAHRVYRSEQMGISFAVPEGYEVMESFNTIYLKNNMHEITISRISTNSKNIPSYLDVYQQLQKVKVEAEKVNLNNYEVYKGVVSFPISKRSDQYSYYIYTAPWTVIVISSPTDDATTFELVKSFRIN